MPEANNTQPAAETQFMINRIYVKDLSLETSDTPNIFQQRWEPELTLDINNHYNHISGDTYEVILTITVTVKNLNKDAFLVEIKQAGLFTIQGAPKEQLEHLLCIYCPSILFPYAREAITTEVQRGSFPQLVLAPVNFEALYLQQRNEAKKAQENAEASPN